MVNKIYRVNECGYYNFEMLTSAAIIWMRQLYECGNYMVKYGMYEILLSEMKFLQKLGSSKTFRWSNAIVLYSAHPSEGDGNDVITV